MHTHVRAYVHDCKSLLGPANWTPLLLQVPHLGVKLPIGPLLHAASGQ